MPDMRVGSQEGHDATQKFKTDHCHNKVATQCHLYTGQ